VDYLFLPLKFSKHQTVVAEEKELDLKVRKKYLYPLTLILCEVVSFIKKTLKIWGFHPRCVP